MVTLRELIDGAADRADMTAPAEGAEVEFVGWDAAVRFVNDGIKKLWRVATSQKKPLYYRTSNFTLSGSTHSNALPADFARAFFVEIWPDTSRRQRVERYSVQERDAWKYSAFPYPYTICDDRGYAILGAQGASGLIQIQPQERAAASYRLYYVPQPTLFDGSDEDAEMDDELAPYDTYVKEYVAGQMAKKEESYERAKDCAAECAKIELELIDALDVDEAAPAAIIDIYS